MAQHQREDVDTEPRGPLRQGYTAELDQLRIQVELLSVHVDENLERMRRVLADGDAAAASAALAADDGIDAMCVSLTGRCYDVLAREQPVASDLRFVVSVLRVLAEFERIGDLALRVVNLVEDHSLLTSNPPTFDLLLTMAEEGIERYRTATRAWAVQEEVLAASVTVPSPAAVDRYRRLTEELLHLSDPGAVRVAIPTLVAARSLDRISDHAGIIGTRLLYLLTGDADHLADEVR